MTTYTEKEKDGLREILIKNQNGRCAFCNRPQAENGIRGYRVRTIDHDHSCSEGHDPKKMCPKCVRGLLHSDCNRYLRTPEDDPHLQTDYIKAYLRARPFVDGAAEFYALQKSLPESPLKACLP